MDYWFHHHERYYKAIRHLRRPQAVSISFYAAYICLVKGKIKRSNQPRQSPKFTFYNILALVHNLLVDFR